MSNIISDNLNNSQQMVEVLEPYYDQAKLALFYAPKVARAIFRFNCSANRYSAFYSFGLQGIFVGGNFDTHLQAMANNLNEMEKNERIICEELAGIDVAGKVPFNRETNKFIFYTSYVGLRYYLI